MCALSIEKYDIYFVLEVFNGDQQLAAAREASYLL
jgi:hypothetical protein